MDSRPIGIFDSGIGGLTVLEELEKKLPSENYLYFGDTLNFPYGEKTKEEIIEFSKKNIEYLINKNVKCIIIACGTATSQALSIVQKNANIPIIGIIRPTVKYVKSLKIRKIGVIATTGTIKSGAWEINLKEEIPNIQVINQACPLLANIAEEGMARTKQSIEAIHSYMQIFKENKVNTLILGCTHYPIFDRIIKKEFKNKISLINAGKSVAVELNNILEQYNMKNNGKKTNTKIIISKEEHDFDKKAKNILKSAKMLDITKVY